MLFAEKVAVYLASAKAMGATPYMRSLPEPEKGDQIVAVVKDPALLALMVVVRNMEEDFSMRYASAPRSEAEWKRMQTEASDVDAAKGLLSYELHRAFRVNSATEIRLCQGLKNPLAVISPEPEPDRTLDFLSAVEALTGGAPNCGDPNCPSCGPAMRLARRFR